MKRTARDVSRKVRMWLPLSSGVQRQQGKAIQNATQNADHAIFCICFLFMTTWDSNQANCRISRDKREQVYKSEWHSTLTSTYLCSSTFAFDTRLSNIREPFYLFLCMLHLSTLMSYSQTLTLRLESLFLRTDWDCYDWCKL